MSEPPSAFIQAFVSTVPTDASWHDWARLLNAAEIARCERYRSERDASAFAFRRVVLRQRVSDLWGIPLTEIAVEQLPSGEVRVKSRREQRPCLSVSLSGRRSVVACALSSSPVGVDVEPLEHQTDWRRIVEAAMTPAEAEAIACSDDPSRATLRHWTLKEAYLKALGRGFSDDPRNVGFDLRGDAVRLVRRSVFDPGTTDWRLCSHVREGRVLALACADPSPPDLQWLP